MKKKSSKFFHVVALLKKTTVTAKQFMSINDFSNIDKSHGSSRNNMIEVEEQEKTYCPSCLLVAITVLGYCSLQPFQAVKQ